MKRSSKLDQAAAKGRNGLPVEASHARRQKLLMKRLVALFFPLLLGSLRAQADDCLSLARQAIEVSGLDLGIDQMAALARSDKFFEQVTDGRTLPPEAAILVRRAMGDAFAAQSMKNDLEIRLASGCKPEQMSRTLLELKSPGTSHMLHREVEAHTAESQQELEEYIGALSQAPPSQDRMSSIQKLDDSTGATDFSVSELVAIQRGMMGVDSVQPEASSAALEQYRVRMKKQIHEGILLSLLFIYRNATKEDLERYTVALRAGPVKAFYDQARQALLTIIEERSKHMAEDIKKKTALPGVVEK